MVSLVEPELHKKLSDKKLVAHSMSALKIMIRKPILLQSSLLLFAALLTANIQFEFNHLHLIFIGYGAIGLGFLNAGLALSGALGNVVAHKIKRRYFLFLPGLLAIISLGFPFFGSQIVVPLLLFILLFVRAIIDNSMQSAIQDNITSDIRATSLSVIGFATNIVAIPMVLIFGYLSKQYDTGFAYIIYGVLLCLFIAGLYVHARSKNITIFDGE